VYPVFAEELSDEQTKVKKASDVHKEARRLIGQIRNTQGQQFEAAKESAG
jgi:hypothetical protein